MVNVFEKVLSAFYLSGFAVLCGALGYYHYRYAEELCRRGAEATKDMPRFFRWLSQSKFFSSPECVSRYRATGIAQMVVAGLFLILAVGIVVMGLLAAKGALR
jgi:hypothetical protein